VTNSTRSWESAEKNEINGNVEEDCGGRYASKGGCYYRRDKQTDGQAEGHPTVI